MGAGFGLHEEFAAEDEDYQHARADGEDVADAGVVGKDAAEDETGDLCAKDERHHR